MRRQLPLCCYFVSFLLEVPSKSWVGVLMEQKRVHLAQEEGLLVLLRPSYCQACFWLY